MLLPITATVAYRRIFQKENIQSFCNGESKLQNIKLKVNILQFYTTKSTK